MRKGLYGNIIVVNLKHNFPAPCASAIGIFLLTLLLFDVTALQAGEAAKPIEFLLCWVGVMFLTPVFLPEQNKNIRDVICSKKVDYLKVCMLRVLYSAAATAVFVSLFVGIMRARECDVDASILFGGIATALFLGAVGFAAAGISQNTTIGYMAAFAYYLASYGMKGKLGKFYLFSMTAGNTADKGWLFAAAILLIGMTFVIMKLRQKL